MQRRLIVLVVGIGAQGLGAGGDLELAQYRGRNQVHHEVGIPDRQRRNDALDEGSP